MGASVKITARIPPALVAEIDRLVQAGYYSSRSEVIKEALRDFIMRNKFLPKETKDEEYLKAIQKMVEPILAEDWESEADEYWSEVKGVKYEPEM
ncbi:ribbon-helix-helix domain-containing protein [Thermococcus piezophilus]|uniref:CopG family transcriptional regulator n=1 Tax=Thermococcus piezophilus TaxID=1712654 RepID=A0A172WGR3_9EURY|nr:ribbon-helix-helix domain-containing protein [Thermococcus piezophilus]ANF22634.1 CopG family transcriptional regulator [Thermococcus piezophilus]